MGDPCLANTFCQSYTTALPVSVWPQQPYPATLGQRLSVQALAVAIKAWNFYEQVEAHDAQQRQVLQPKWWTFSTMADFDLYQRGRLLHWEICPCVDWSSQRYLGYVGPGGNVLPRLC